nr:hypothetical protein [Tanacetum cinerariifolium]
MEIYQTSRSHRPADGNGLTTGDIRVTSSALTVVTTSSIEAEYVAAASCCAQVLWIQNQLLDYGSKQSELKRSKEFSIFTIGIRAIWRTLLKKTTFLHNTFFFMDSLSTPVVSAAKLPILNPNEFDLWKFENFTGSSSKNLDQIHDRLQKLVSQLKIHGVSLSQEDVNLKFLRSNPTQNLTFVSSTNIDNTTDSVSAATSVSAVCAKLPVSSHPNIDSLSNAVIFSFFVSQSTSPQLDNKDLKQIDTGKNLGDNRVTSMGFDMSKVECYNCNRKGHFARECRSPKDSRRSGATEQQRRTALVENSTSNTLVSQCDGIGSYDWSYQADEDPANFALMAITSSSSSSDNETNEKHGLGYFSSESDCESLSPGSPSDRLQPSGGYHVVPPPITGTFMPPKPNLVFYTAHIAVETDHYAFTVQLSSSKPAQDLSHITRPLAPIIKDCDYHAKKKGQPTPRNYAHRGYNKKNASFTHKHPPKHMVPAAVLTQSKPVSITAFRPISADVPKIMVTRPRHAHSIDTKYKSPIRRHITHSPSPNTSNSPHRVTPAQALVGNPQYALKDKGVIDRGCSRHMAGNMSYLSNFEELNGGYVAFGGNPKGGKISGKGKIKTGEEVNQQYVLFPMWSSGFTNSQNNDEDAAFDEKEHDAKKPESKVNVSPSSSAQSGKQDDKTKKKAKGKSRVESFIRNRDLSAEFEDHYDNSSNDVNAIEADFNNLETSITVSPIPTTRTHKDHPVSQIIGDLSLTTQTRSMTRVIKDQGQLVPKGFTKKKDERGIVVRNKARLVAQVHIQEEGIDYEEVFTPVARIEAIRLFLAYASFMGFLVYQMDAPRAWYETLANYLLDNGFHKGKIDQTLFIKKQKGDILLVQIYVKQKKDGLFISQDKYVANILKKFGLLEGKSASTPIDTEKPLLKDLDGEDVDVHIYRSMIGSLMYLTSSRPDIMFASNDVTRLQDLFDKKKVLTTEAAIKDVLRLDDVEGVDCLPNEKIFTELARMGYEKPSKKLTFYKAFFSSQWKFLIHTILQSMSAKRTSWNDFISAMASAVICLSTEKGCSGVETPLFEGMLVVGEIEEQGDAEEHDNVDDAAQEAATAISGDDVQDQSIPSPTLPTPPPQQPQDIPSTSQEALDACAALTRRVEHLEHDKVAQDLEITKLKTRVKKLERANKGFKVPTQELLLGSKRYFEYWKAGLVVVVYGL